ncbi:hypothetical protein TPHA_0P00750 [Tetrapisispora phaffii CBS 4417]|uniref:Protein ZIP4 homolog n=1 Tax=Tetrapisispora phaffii (strain ATCC 24235 / CBS 4417 / NBRC 1672 / NRRL Y-8282 / UCD 70-5) TaxID=1071381 RepID=G8C255_TETPH|nr:hypothetical protein TPHA_0P00750 [Tetrapisispora phaffii CBS 4417]CCE66233.1 hypothetical protein TPHA_0P00750 [Tetrapisispora phaffii CBS 4417]
MSEMNSVVKATLEEFCDSSVWLVQQFSSNLENTFSSVENRLDGLQPMAEKYERLFRTSPIIIDEELCLKLENNSTSLWNQITMIEKSKNNKENQKILFRCKVYATILLSIYESLSPTVVNKLMVLKCYITVLKGLEGEFYDQQILRNIQEQCDKLLIVTQDEINDNKIKNHLETEQKEKDFNNLRIEYLIINFQLALAENDYELASIYFSKVDINENTSSMNPKVLLELCRLIYNAILQQYQNFNEEIPNIDILNSMCHYLRNTSELFTLNKNMLKTEVNYSSMHFSIFTLHAELLMLQPSTDINWEFINSIIEQLQTEYPKKIESHLLSYKVRNKTMHPENLNEELKELIMKMIINIDIKENFEAITNCISDFAQKSITLANVCLDYIFGNKLDPQRDQTIFEKLICIRVYLTTQSSQLNTSEMISSLKDYCTKIEHTIVHEVGLTTVSTIITLFWNTGKTLQKRDQFLESNEFYNLALMNIFCQNYADRSKIQRALIQNFIQLDDMGRAKEIYQTMDYANKKLPLSQLLLLKILYKENDIKGCEECFSQLKINEGDSSVECLILGVEECKDNIELSLKAMQMLFEKLEEAHFAKDDKGKVSFPIFSLTRYIIQLITKVTEKNGNESFLLYYSVITNLLSKSLEYFKVLQDRTVVARKLNANVTTEIISIDEIEWFSSTCYNIASKCFRENIQVDIDRIVTLAIEYFSLIPIEDVDFSIKCHFKYWYFRTKLLALAVSSSKLSGDTNDQKRLMIEKKVENLNNEIIELINSKDMKDKGNDDEKTKINSCLIELLRLTFEDIMSTKNKEKILAFIKKSYNQNEKQIEILFFSMTVNNPNLSQSIAVYIMEMLIDRNTSSNLLGVEVLLRWLKIYMNFILDLDMTCKFLLVEQLSKQLQQENIPKLIEKQEVRDDLEIISTLCWNQGINLIMEEDKVNANVYCKQALYFAELANPKLCEQLKQMWNALEESK